MVCLQVSDAGGVCRGTEPHLSPAQAQRRHPIMHLLFRGRLKLLAASLAAVLLLTWLYLLAGNLESELRRHVAIETAARRA